MNPIQRSQEYKKAMRQFRKEHPGALPGIITRPKSIIRCWNKKRRKIQSPNPVTESPVTVTLVLGQQGTAEAVTNPPQDLHRNQPTMSGLGLPVA